MLVIFVPIIVLNQQPAVGSAGIRPAGHCSQGYCSQRRCGGRPMRPTDRDNPAGWQVHRDVRGCLNTISGIRKNTSAVAVAETMISGPSF